MIIKTRKLPMTAREPARMRATTDTGVTLTIPYPWASTNPDETVASCLARAFGWEDCLVQLRPHVWTLDYDKAKEQTV